MVLGLSYFGNLFYFGLFLINAVAVLSEERFLARIGWSAQSPSAQNQAYDSTGYGGAAGQPEQSIKARLITLVTAVRTLMRIPLIAVNLVVIVYELILGG
jgi:hypothetical protein